MQNWFPITISQSKFFQNRCLQTQIPNLCFFSTKVFQNTMSNLTKSYLTAKTTKQGQFGSSAKAPNTEFSQGENTKHTKHWVQHLHYALPSCLLEEWKKATRRKRYIDFCTHAYYLCFEISLELKHTLSHLESDFEIETFLVSCLHCRTSGHMQSTCGFSPPCSLPPASLLAVFSVLPMFSWSHDF